MARVRSHVVRHAGSVYKQSALGTAPPTITQLNVYTSCSQDSVPSYDIDYAVQPYGEQAGQEAPMHMMHTKKSVVLNNFRYDLSVLSAAMIVPFAMGTAASSGSSPTTLQYLSKLMAPGSLPATAMLMEGQNGSQVLLYDLICTGFEIAGSGNQDSKITITPTWQGLGNFSEDQSYTFDATNFVMRPDICTMGGLTMTYGAAGSPTATTITNRIRSFRFGVQNNIFDPYAPGTMLTGSRADTGNMRAVTCSFQVESDGSDDWLDDLKAATANRMSSLKALRIKMKDNGGSKYVQIDLAQCYFTAVATSHGDDQVIDVTVMAVEDPGQTGYAASTPFGVSITNYCMALLGVTFPGMVSVDVPLTAFS